jgi:hypothetical protein
MIDAGSILMSQSKLNATIKRYTKYKSQRRDFYEGLRQFRDDKTIENMDERKEVIARKLGLNLVHFKSVIGAATCLGLMRPWEKSLI